jgi:hypothetical protein
MYAFAPEKPPSLVGRNFCLAIVIRESSKFRYEVAEEQIVRGCMAK